MQNKLQVIIEMIDGFVYGRFEPQDLLLPGDKFCFYLLKDGKLEDKNNNQGYIKENEYKHKISDSGIYMLHGFLKRNDNIEIIFSLPKSFYTQDDKNEYRRFLEKDLNKTEINEKLSFYPIKYPNQDFLICSYKQNVKNILDELTKIKEKYNLGETNKLNKIGEWNNIIISRFLDKRGEESYCLSGVAMVEKKYINGYSEAAELPCNIYQKIRDSYGMYTMAEIKNKKIRITNDFFNFQPLYYYMTNNIVLISNRYHLLLIALNQLDCHVEINYDKAILNLAFNESSVLMIQNYSHDMDVMGCKQLNNGYDLVLDKNGWKFEKNQFGIILEKGYGVTEELSQELIEKGSKEVLEQVSSLINDDRFDYIVSDLSGGLDTRIIYAAITNVKDAYNRIRINAEDVGNDLPVALRINGIYNYNFVDGIEKEVEYISIKEADVIARSNRLGTYYAHGIIPAYVHTNSIRLVGALGECSFRRGFSTSMQRRNVPINATQNQYVDEMFQWNAFTLICDGDIVYKRFNNIFNELFDEYGTEMLSDEKLDRMYLEFRHAYHFTTMNPYTCCERRYYPMQSKYIFELQHLMYDKLDDIEIEVAVLKKLNPLLTYIPFEKESDNVKFEKIRFQIDNENIFNKIRLNLEYDEKNWRESINKKSQNVSIKGNRISERMDYTMLKEACLYNLQKLLQFDDFIESNLGIHLYKYVSKYDANNRNIKVIYNKITSLLDQMEIIYEKKTIKQKKISIYGSCVSRDVFRFDINNVFEIPVYIARTSIISNLDKKEWGIKENDIALSSNFQKSCVLLDMNKGVYRKLAQEKGDYIIIDFIDERFKIACMYDKCATWSNELLNSGFLTGKEYELKDKLMEDKVCVFNNMPIDKYIEEFALKIRDIYEEDKIIIHKAYMKEEYYDKNGDLKKFNDAICADVATKNQIMEYMYSKLEQILKNAQVIDISQKNYKISEKHLWGLTPMHYEDAYYEDILNEIKKIVNE